MLEIIMQTELTRITQLREEIEFHNKLYYEEDSPVIQDSDYDKLFRELQALELKYPETIVPTSPTQKVGGRVSEKFASVKHAFPMLSLKTETDYTDNGAISFYNSVKQSVPLVSGFYCEPKYDGLGIDLYYVDGVLVQALTRGDGEFGEDVTENVRQINDIPNRLYPNSRYMIRKLRIRGEIMMSKESFRICNEKLIKANQKPLANPRNAAAGALRVLDPNITKERNLCFYPYSVIQVELTDRTNLILQNHSDYLELLFDLGFNVSDLNKAAFTADDLINFHQSIGRLRQDLPFEIDGVVYKVNNIQEQQALGYISREPKWAIAHKYLAEEKETTVIDIEIQIGRTGKVTPVARLEPVFVGGTTITNVTLHNLSEIRRKDIRKGYKVKVRRAGDVIPEIVCSVPEDTIAPMFQMPTHCPECNSPLQQIPGQVDWRCTGGNYCPAQSLGSILHFIQRKAVFIDGLGEKRIEQLIDLGIVKDIVDIYCLGARNKANEKKITLAEYLKQLPDSSRYQLAFDTLSSLDRTGDASIRKLLSAIESSKKTTLAKFIYALGIRHVGEGTAKRLCKNYSTLAEIMSAQYRDLIQIEDIGDIVAESLVNYFANPDNKTLISNLLLLGFKLSNDQVCDNVLEGLNLVITGTFDEVKRDKVVEQLSELGAKFSSKVTKHTHLLICGKNAGSKFKDAMLNEIPIIQEAQLLNLLANPQNFNRWKK